MAVKIQNVIDRVSSHVTLWQLLPWGSLVASFALPAWATYATNLFAEFQPFSWVVAGFAGLALWVFLFWLWQVAFGIRIRAKYDARLLDKGSRFNPLDKIFNGDRIFIDTLVLPSYPVIDGRTFVDCDLIGPATMYLAVNNQAPSIRPPRIEAIYLDPSIKFDNGIIFTNCIFRNCSFQRITILVSAHDYDSFKQNNMLSWISLTPDSIKQTPLLDGIISEPEENKQS